MLLLFLSFGEDTKLLHSFEENFNEQSGASILQQFTFDQKKTKIAHLLKMCTLLFDGAKKRQHTNSSAQVSQLLLIVSDGRGIFLEGKEVCFISYLINIIVYRVLEIFTYYKISMETLSEEYTFCIFNFNCLILQYHVVDEN